MSVSPVRMNMRRTGVRWPIVDPDSSLTTRCGCRKANAAGIKKTAVHRKRVRCAATGSSRPQESRCRLFSWRRPRSSRVNLSRVAGADADVTGLITADHGWGRSSNAATESSAGDTVVLATAADDHGWG